MPGDALALPSDWSAFLARWSAFLRDCSALALAFFRVWPASAGVWRAGSVVWYLARVRVSFRTLCRTEDTRLRHRRCASRLQHVTKTWTRKHRGNMALGFDVFSFSIILFFVLRHVSCDFPTEFCEHTFLTLGCHTLWSHHSPSQSQCQRMKKDQTMSGGRRHSRRVLGCDRTSLHGRTGFFGQFVSWKTGLPA